MPETAAPVVSLRSLSRTFGMVKALDDVTLDVPAGAVGLLGPNGAGKSTMLKILLGLLPPTAGSVSVLGLDPAKSPVEARRRVGYMPEQDAYVTGITAVDFTAWAGVLSGIPRGAALLRADLVLSYVGMDDVRHRKVETLSTGMRQRVRLAQALIHDPPLLFLDEPTNGLDPEGRGEVLQVIGDLVRRHGKSVVLCSHLLRDVESLCDRVVVLNRGRVIRQGTMEEVRGGRKDFFRAAGRGPTAAFEEALARAGCTTLPGGAPGRLAVGVPAGAGTAPVFRAAAECGFDLRHLAPEETSLEEVFVEALAGGGGA